MIWKVAFIGDSGVGKTSLIHYFKKGTISDVTSTQGIDFYGFSRGDTKITVWDIAGQEWFRHLVVKFIEGAHIIVMVFDLSRLETLQNLVNFWADEVKKHSTGTPFIIVVGNKKDIQTISDDTISEVLDNLRKKINYNIFIKTSAKTGENVHKLFDIIFEAAKIFLIIHKK